MNLAVRFSENAGKDGMLSDQELDEHGFSESNQKFSGCLILKRKKFPIEESELYYDRYGPSEMFKVSEDIVYVYAYHYPNSCIWAPDYFVLEDEEVKEGAQGELGAEDDNSLDSGVLKEDSDEWDEFGDMEDRSMDELDPRSWRNILEETLSRENISSTEEGLYIFGVNKMMFVVSEGETELMKEAISNIHLVADGGYAHAQSTRVFCMRSEVGLSRVMQDRSMDELDPRSWRKILEENLSRENISSIEEGLYISGVNKMMFAVSEGEPELMKEAISDIHFAADGGYAHAQYTLGFLYEI